MNLHLHDKMNYYLPVIFKLDKLDQTINTKKFFNDLNLKSKRKLIPEWEKALEESFQLHLVYSLALYYALERNKNKSEQFLRFAHQKKGFSQGANIIRCIEYCEMAMFDEAMQIIKNLPILFTKMSFILRIKADIFFAQKEYKKAEDYYLQILKDSFSKSSILSRLGEINMLRNKLDEAYDYFSKAIKLDSENIMAHFYLGDIYKLQGDINKAKMEYGISAAIDRDNTTLSKMAQQKLFLLCAERAL